MRERYSNLDGLRTVSCLCLIAMHIKANADYSISSFFQGIMVSWTHFVLLFLFISGFGMCCGYYEKFKNTGIDLNGFYLKRYKKILPFFLTLIVLDIIFSRELSHIIEGITESTLVFGLLPNNSPDVIGVSWTLGVIFLFYMLFPFVVFLCWTKKRAWVTFIASIIINLFCSVYYFSGKFVVEMFTPRHSFLFCSPYFIGGVLIYLYRENIKRFVSYHRWLWLCICILTSVVWYLIPNDIQGVDISSIAILIVLTMWVMYAISVNSIILSNAFTKYISGISMEMYLSHMFVYRIVEKFHGLYVFGHGWISLVFSWFLVVLVLIVFIQIWTICKNKILELFSRGCFCKKK